MTSGPAEMLAAVTLLPVAHAGHWYFMPLYAAPVLIILYSAIATTVRERRTKREEESRGSGASRSR
jgi:hypothetical protein